MYTSNILKVIRISNEKLYLCQHVLIEHRAL